MTIMTAGGRKAVSAVTAASPRLWELGVREAGLEGGIHQLPWLDFAAAGHNPSSLRFHWSTVACKLETWRLLTAFNKSIQELVGRVAQHPRVQEPNPDVTLQQHTGKEEK